MDFQPIIDFGCNSSLNNPPLGFPPAQTPALAQPFPPSPARCLFTQERFKNHWVFEGMMARRKKIGELKDSETECGYCDKIIPENAMKCPECGKYFSSFKKLMAFSIVVVIVLAGMSFFVPGSFDLISKISPTFTFAIAFLASSKGPGQEDPLASTLKEISSADGSNSVIFYSPSESFIMNDSVIVFPFFIL